MPVSPGAWSVRRAAPDDADGIARVHVRGWQEAYAHIVPASTLEALDVAARAERWRTSPALMAGDPECWVGERDGEIVGFALSSTRAGEDRPRDTELDALYILASEYGTGVGRALIDAALGGRPAFLRVFQDNPRAIAFYRRNGFEVESASTYEFLGVEAPDYRMVR